jgi:APA family basic amino acid/polyamine antiporter
VFVALISLRLKEPQTPRRFKIPLNVNLRYKGNPVAFPIVGVLGFAGIFSILVFVLLTHPIGRIAGPSWLLAGLVGYLLYRKRRQRPLLHSMQRNWYKEQTAILIGAGELELLDEYRANCERFPARENASTALGAAGCARGRSISHDDTESSSRLRGV